MRLPTLPPFALPDLTVRTPLSSAQPPPLVPLLGGSEAPPPQSTTTATGAPGRTRPARWSSSEFRLYELAVLAGVLVMAWTGAKFGPGHPNYSQFVHRLRPGWIMGRAIDVTDPQYSSFRTNLPSLLGLASTQLALRHAMPHALALFTSSSSGSRCPSPRALNRFHTIFALIALSVMHGFNALKVVGLVLANHALSRRLAGGKHAVWAAWASVGLALILTEKTEGFRGLLPAALERHAGLLPRWHVSFNITALRLLSFALDHHWARAEPSTIVADNSRPNEATDETGVPLGTTRIDGSNAATRTSFAAASSVSQAAVVLSPSARARTPRPLAEYASITGCLAHALYTPLYVAGPIVTFNNFAAQMASPPPVSAQTTIRYALRLACSLLTMEVLLHFIPAPALTASKALGGLSPGELGVLGFWNLVVVWLKLLLPWRLFRLWALLDGLDAPENMVRCVANNYSCAGFWRSWHRSYNLWVVRYIYVPVGGSRRPYLSTLVVFTFVALWHDLTFRLLIWGWLITLVVAPEMAARRLIPSSKFGEQPWFRHAVALGGTVNVMTMCAANLVGFVLGLDGMRDLLSGIWSSWHGVTVGVLSTAGVFAAVQLMIEYREEERRHGIFRKY